MRFVKTIAFLVVVSFSLDALLWGGAYRRHLGRDIQDAAMSVSASDWLGLDEV